MVSREIGPQGLQNVLDVSQIEFLIFFKKFQEPYHINMVGEVKKVLRMMNQRPTITAVP